jgi:uncharacterized protein YfiM (DUF2279 family)
MAQPVHGVLAMERIERICRFVHHAWVAYQLGAGQAYNLEPDAQDLRSNRIGVESILANPEAGPEAQHELWMQTRLADGWKWGPVKDKEAKLHPDLVPYDQLPDVEQRKDLNFYLAVKAALTLFPEE